MNTLLLSIHPFFQSIGILLAFYGAILGLQRARILHFGQQGVVFRRRQHAMVGAAALFMLLGGLAGGKIITALLWQETAPLHGHQRLAMVLLPLLLVGIGTGLYLYFLPEKRKVLPIVHALNNGVLFILLLVQAYSGIQVYLHHVIKW